MEEAMEELHFKEVKQTPLQKAITAYKFIFNDLREGLNYNVSVEYYNMCMKGINSNMRIEVHVTAETFCEDFYKEYTKFQSGTVSKNKGDKNGMEKD